MSLPSPDRYAVIGHPVAHSLSPQIHARFAEMTGEHLSYERLLAPLDGFEASARAFALAGGKGANVTVPFKFQACELAQHLTHRAQLAGAANTLRFDGATPEQGWHADNTDGAGLVADITVNAGIDLRGRKVLIIGAGGAVSGVLGPILDAGPREVCVANRSLDRAEQLVARHAQVALEHQVELRSARLENCGIGFHVVINGTSASLQGAGVPVSKSVLASGALAIDMMYGPAAQPFLDWAAACGASGRDGLGMLVEQAAVSFEFWRGIRPDASAVLSELRTWLGGRMLQA